MMNSIDESDHSVKRLLFIFGAQGVSFARLLAQASTSDQRGVVSLAWADPRLSDLKSQTRHPKPQSGSSHLILLVALNASEDLTRSAFCSMGQKDTCSMFSHTHSCSIVVDINNRSYWCHECCWVGFCCAMIALSQDVSTTSNYTVTSTTKTTTVTTTATTTSTNTTATLSGTTTAATTTATTTTTTTTSYYYYYYFYYYCYYYYYYCYFSCYYFSCYDYYYYYYCNCC